MENPLCVFAPDHIGVESTLNVPCKGVDTPLGGPEDAHLLIHEPCCECVVQGAAFDDADDGFVHGLDEFGQGIGLAVLVVDVEIRPR